MAVARDKCAYTGHRLFLKGQNGYLNVICSYFIVTLKKEILTLTGHDVLPVVNYRFKVNFWTWKQQKTHHNVHLVISDMWLSQLLGQNQQQHVLTLLHKQFNMYERSSIHTLAALTTVQTTELPVGQT